MMASQREGFRLDEEEEEEEEEKTPRMPDQDFMMQRFLKTRTVLLTGEINKDSGERVIRQLLLMEAMGSDPIKVFIDSPGGDVDAGFAIYDMMRFINAPVYTIGMGLVASAAALILISAPAERRLGLPNSHYLIHQPLSGMRGVATEIEIHARELEKVKTKLTRLTAEATGKELSQVEKDMDRDYWMASEEAIQYGLISKIVGSRQDLPVCSKNKSKPSSRTPVGESPRT